MSDLPPPAGRKLDFSKLCLKTREQRSHKVRLDLLGKPTPRGCSFAEWLDSLPGFLGANEFRATVRAIVAARRAGRPVLFGFGGHVVKTGCSPLIIDMMQRGIFTGICTNGSGAIHDLELAETGETSEEVAETIRDGTFGMVVETCERMNAAATRGATGSGLGRALGELLLEGKAPHADLSLFAAAARLNLPATIHVALGTDTVHMHPLADGGAIGQATMHDFRTFCSVVADMTAVASDARSVADAPGGVYLNVGSAVVLPEVFLKAVSVARNLGHSLAGMHTANFDMLRHYRPAQNVVGRPVAPGCGHSVTGQHEILLPMLRQAVIEQL
ncbi:MAG: hypothetical protein ACKVS9_12350 [Phycisphaerae bacterium]